MISSFLHSKINPVSLSTVAAVCCISLLSNPAYGQSDEQTGSIKMLSPAIEEGVIGKKPQFRFQLDSSLVDAPILVMFDGSDITPMIQRSNEFVDYKAVTALNSGEHTISVIYLSPNGQEQRKDFTFHLRHTKPFEEAQAVLSASPIYEGVIHKTDGYAIPNSKIEANLGVSGGVKEGRWRTSLESNFRYLDQSLSVQSPQSKGIDLANYLVNVDYDSDNTKINAAVGDVVIDESPMTVSGFGRRGAKISFQNDGYSVGAFSTNTAQVSGFNGGTGLETSSKDHLYGLSVGKKFTPYNSYVKALYMTGGQNKDGSSTVNTLLTTPREGNTMAMLAGATLFDNALNIDGEFDLSRYDVDTTDSYDKETDRAYKLRIGGTRGSFAYDALYQYIGTQYRVIGNEGLERDKEGVTLQGRYFESVHSLDVTFSDFYNNVDNNPLYATIQTQRGSVGYQYSGVDSLPLSLRYEKNYLSSSNEPSPDSSVKIDTDAVSVSANYLKESWNFGAMAKYSRQNDKTLLNNDSKVISYMFNPTYFSQRITIVPGFMFSRSISPLITTDTSSASFHLLGNETLFDNEWTYTLSSIYTKTKNDMGTYDQNSLSSELRLAYLFHIDGEWLTKPSVGLRGIYNRQVDNITEQSVISKTLLFFVSLPVNYTF